MILPLLLVLTQLDAGDRQAGSDGVIKLVLKVKEQKASPVPRATGVNCDDRSVVEVVDQGERIELKGLAIGKTLCAFNQGLLPPRVVEITVRR